MRERGNQHALAARHALLHDLREDESLSGSWRPLDEVAKIDGNPLRDGFALHFIDALFFSRLRRCLEAIEIHAGHELAGEQRQNPLPTPRGAAKVSDGIAVK